MSPAVADLPPGTRSILASASPVAPLCARARPVGPVAGVWGADPERERSALEALRVVLGPGATLVGSRGIDARAFGSDHDACVLDGARLDAAGLEAALRGGRVADIEGGFAAAWVEDGALVLARDAIGERRLYHAPFAGGVVFSSRLRALLDAGLVPRRLDLRSVAAFLSYAYVPGERTLVEDLCELLPATELRFARGRASTSTFWRLPAEPASGFARDEAHQARALRGDLERAVARCLPASGPVGATLSGGVDSSLVVALARQLHSGDILTWSVTFGDGYANELPWSSLVARHCGTRHHVVEISPSAVLAHLDATHAELPDPIGDPLTVPNVLLFREAACEVGVVLNGEGGDPCFGGPKNLPMVLATWLGDGLEEDPHHELARARTYLRAHQKCFDDLDAALAPDVANAIHGDPLERDLVAALEDPRWGSLIDRLNAMNVVLKGAHHILAKVDALSAPFGVLPRAPLFDRKVVERAFTLAPEQKLRGTTEKWMLKRAIADLLPGAILERPKSGMLVPVEAWFRGPLLPRARERLLDGLAARGLFRREWLERVARGRLPGVRPRVGAKTWLLLTLESWLRGVFDGTQHGYASARVD